MSRHFNLVSEKWIPVVSRSGVQEEVGLERIFTDPEILDLIVSPCERISLMALFAAIAHAAVEGPATYEDWCNLPKALPVAASSYLAKWRDCFDLWSEDKPFLQLPGLRYTQADRKLNMASKLDFAAAAGSNSCLFDNSFDQAIPRTYRDAELALRLLTYQCFSPGGLIGIVNWRGHASGMEKKSEAALYGVDGAWHAIVQRPTLLHTLIFNLPTRAQVADQGWTNWGKALWEQMPQGYEDHAAICNATRSYLGRLIPLSRSILLNPDRKHLVLGNGLSYPRSLPALMSLTQAGGKILSSKGAPVWQQVPAFTAVKQAGRGGVKALGRIGEGEPARLWLGALNCRQSKILGERQTLLELDPALLGEAGCRRYSEGIALAERWERALSKACKSYRVCIVSGALSHPEEGKAKHYFWQELERRQDQLRAWAGAQELAEIEAKKSAWQRLVVETARKAFAFACPSATLRRRFAWIHGLRKLDNSPRRGKEASHER